MEVYQWNLLRWRRWDYMKYWTVSHRHRCEVTMPDLPTSMLATSFLKEGLLKYNSHEIKSTLFSVGFYDFCQMHSQITTTTTRTLRSFISPPKSLCTVSQLLFPAPLLGHHWSVSLIYFNSLAFSRMQCKWNQQLGDFLSLASFTRQNALKIHSHNCVHQ